MKSTKAQREAATARETRIEGIIAAMAFSAMVAYFIGRNGTPLSLQDSVYGALIIAAFFATLYVIGAGVVFGFRSLWRLAKGTAKRAAEHGEASAATLDPHMAVLASDVETIKARMDELLSSARRDGGRIEEMHAAFKEAEAARQRH